MSPPLPQSFEVPDKHSGANSIHSRASIRGRASLPPLHVNASQKSKLLARSVSLASLLWVASIARVAPARDSTTQENHRINSAAAFVKRTARQVGSPGLMTGTILPRSEGAERLERSKLERIMPGFFAMALSTSPS
jgi:hypothetical protein